MPKVSQTRKPAELPTLDSWSPVDDCISLFNEQHFAATSTLVGVLSKLSASDSDLGLLTITDGLSAVLIGDQAGGVSKLSHTANTCTNALRAVESAVYVEVLETSPQMVSSGGLPAALEALISRGKQAEKQAQLSRLEGAIAATKHDLTKHRLRSDRAFLMLSFSSGDWREAGEDLNAAIEQELPLHTEIRCRAARVLWKLRVRRAKGLEQECEGLAGLLVPKNREAKLDNRGKGGHELDEMQDREPPSRLPHMPVGGKQTSAAFDVTTALDFVEQRADELSEEELSRLADVFNHAVAMKHERLIFGNRSHHRRWANRTLSLMSEESDMSDEERRSLVDAVRHVGEKYGWVLRLMEPDSAETVPCTLAVDDIPGDRGNRFRIIEKGGKRRSLSKRKVLPPLRFEQH